MIVNMDWGNLNIIVPRTEMLLVQTVPVEVRQLDLTELRLALHNQQESVYGMSYPDIHSHNPPVVVSGVTLAQVVEIINGYTLTFEDGLYNVNIVGGNSNVADITIKNSVGVNTANSAGLQDSQSLQAASFGGEVVISAIDGTAGTVFPIGTRRVPCSNIPDAVVIANREGIDVLRFHSDYLLSTGDNVSEFILRGQNAVLTQLIIGTDADVLNCQITDCTISGILDGGTLLERSTTNGLNYVNGIVYNSALDIEPIILGGNQQAMFIDCTSAVSGTDTPTIDMNGNGQSLAMRNYSGGIRIMNRTGNDPISIDMNSGHVIIDATCTGDPITIRGSYKLTVEAGATAPVTEGRTMMESDIPIIATTVLDADAGCI